MREYINADRQLHFLSQILAKANRTYVAKKEDDSHTNLYFDSLGKRIVGRWIDAVKGRILFTLNLVSQEIAVVDGRGQVVFSVSTIAKTVEAIEQEIASNLPQLGLDQEGFAEKLHYDLPTYDFADQPIGEINAVGMSQWKLYRNLVNQACMELLGHTQMVAEIRIWPHHFDTGIYIVPNEKLGLGFGLAMEDEMAGAPYIYMAAYPLKGAIAYDNLPQSDHWHWKTEDNWKGVILTLTELEKHAEKDRLTILNDYILQNLNWYLFHEN